jgi:exonuclease III
MSLRKRSRLVVLSWNVYSPNPPKRVRKALKRWIRKYDPDIIVLNEARNIHEMLSELDGYVLYQDKPLPKGSGKVPERGNTALLVREGLEVRRHRTVRMERDWMVFSHRRWHEPREFPMVRVKVDDQWWKVRGEHWPTNGFGGGNHAAFLEAATKAKRFGESSKIPTVTVGDLNERKGKLRRFFGIDFEVAGHGIDLLVATRVRRVRCKQLTKRGSDHFAHLFTAIA